MNLTQAQRIAVRWLASRGGDGIFDLCGVLLARGERAPVMRLTWNALQRLGLGEPYNPTGKGRGRYRLTAAGMAHPAALDSRLDRRSLADELAEEDARCCASRTASAWPCLPTWGCQLTAGEVKQVARWLVTLRRIGTRPDGRGNSAAALNALKGMEG